MSGSSHALFRHQHINLKLFDSHESHQISRRLVFPLQEVGAPAPRVLWGWKLRWKEGGGVPDQLGGGAHPSRSVLCLRLSDVRVERVFTEGEDGEKQDLLWVLLNRDQPASSSVLPTAACPQTHRTRRCSSRRRAASPGASPAWGDRQSDSERRFAARLEEGKRRSPGRRPWTGSWCAATGWSAEAGSGTLCRTCPGPSAAGRPWRRPDAEDQHGWKLRHGKNRLVITSSWTPSESKPTADLFSLQKTWRRRRDLLQKEEAATIWFLWLKGSQFYVLLSSGTAEVSKKSWVMLTRDQHLASRQSLKTAFILKII